MRFPVYRFLQIMPTLCGVLSASAIDLTPRADQGLICGQHGWDAGHESFDGVGYSNSYSYCAGVCRLRSSCKSFAYVLSDDKGNGGDCQVYDVPVKGNFVPDASSPYLFYDLACETQNKQCNVKGYSKMDSFYSCTTPDIDICQARCEDFSNGCISYSFGGNNECQIYAYSVSDNAITDASSPYTFSDKICGPNGSSTTSTSTSTSTSKTTKSTTKSTSTGRTTLKTTTTTANSSKTSTLSKTSTTSTKVSSTKSLTTNTSVSKTSVTSSKIQTTTKN